MLTELRDIYLHGSLRKFGKHYRLAVATPAEAVRALCIQIKGLRAAIREGFYRVVVGLPGKRRDRSEEELNAGFARSVHIVPVIAGAGGGKGLAIGLTIAGAALLAVAFAPAALALAGAIPTAAGATVFGVSASTIGWVGVGLLFSGVSSLLATKPELKNGESKNSDSFLFGGAPDRPVAGRVVPVAFGTFRVPCIPVSVQLKNVTLGRQSSRQGADT